MPEGNCVVAVTCPKVSYSTYTTAILEQFLFIKEKHTFYPFNVAEHKPKTR